MLATADPKWCHAVSWVFTGEHGMLYEIMRYHGVSQGIMGYDRVSWGMMGGRSV